MTDFLLSSLIEAALDEDLGQGGDITSLATIPADHQSRAVFVARKRGVIAGLDVAQEVFETIVKNSLSLEGEDVAQATGEGDRFLLRHSNWRSPSSGLRPPSPSREKEIINWQAHIKDGDTVEANTTLATVTGSTRSLLTAERTALNFLSHLSGIATATRELVDLVSHTKAKITDTRKTTPGLRALEKHAVLMGGGVNYRFGLYDAILIKDNHIAALNGDVGAATKSAKNYITKQNLDVPIVVEIDHLDQIEPALKGGATRLLLDNMTPLQLKEAVQKISGRALTEASGGVTKDTVKAIAESGVDFISVGSITHSAPILDIGLDWLK